MMNRNFVKIVAAPLSLSRYDSKKFQSRIGFLVLLWVGNVGSGNFSQTSAVQRKFRREGEGIYLCCLLGFGWSGMQEKKRKKKILWWKQMVIGNDWHFSRLVRKRTVLYARTDLPFLTILLAISPFSKITKNEAWVMSSTCTRLLFPTVHTNNQ